MKDSKTGKAMIKDLLVIGGGGFGREIVCLINRINTLASEPEWNLIGIIDDNPNLKDTVITNVPVIGNVDSLLSYETDIHVICTIGNSVIRESVINRCKLNKHIKFATLIDPAAIVGDSVKIGEGCIVCANTVITVDVAIDSFSIVNLACTIGHDAHLHSFTTLYPTVNVSGFVQIGPNVEIGTGSQIIQGVSIGAGSIIGAGSVVVRDIPAHCTAVGVPAKPIKYHGDPNKKEG